MNVFRLQTPELLNNLFEYMLFKIVVDTSMLAYSYYKFKPLKPITKKIVKAQRMQQEAGTGMDRNERRYQILSKYVKSLFQERAQQERAQRAQTNGQQMPAMPMSTESVIIRLIPMFLSRIFFGDKPAACLYLPQVVKLEGREDTAAKLLLKFLEWGRREDEVWLPGYVSRNAVGFVFGQVYSRVLRRFVFGQEPKLSLRDSIEMQIKMMAAAQNAENTDKKGAKKVDLTGNEDLIEIFGNDIKEMSECDDNKKSE